MVGVAVRAPGRAKQRKIFVDCNCFVFSPPFSFPISHFLGDLTYGEYLQILEMFFENLEAETLAEGRMQANF